MATSDDEHAVSIEMLGPRRSRKYDRRLASTLCSVPVKRPQLDRVEVVVLQMRVVVVIAGDEDARTSCRAAAHAADPRRRSPRSPLRATAAAADPSVLLREAECRNSPHRNSSIRSRNPPHFVADLAGADRSGSYQASPSQRSAGTSRDGIDPVAQQLPELLWRVATARNAACHPDDGDRIGCAEPFRPVSAHLL